MELQTLPIGEQSFVKLRTKNRLYVDKTEFIYRMIQDGTCYFLSRPRRFGKSLLLNTIEAYFQGKKELFEGLYIANQEKEWVKHPVFHLDFSAQSYDSEQKLFSDLNNLNDISRDEEYASICGLTDAEVDRDMVPYIRAFAEKKGKRYDEVREDLRRMYDGYHFVDGTDGLYNPFSVMNALSKKVMGSYWFESGTPTMLVELFLHNHYPLPNLEESIDTAALDSKDGSGDSIIPLLYQSGYLSILRSDEEAQQTWLTFPNKEVNEGFFRFLLPYYSSVQKNHTKAAINSFVDDLRSGNVEQFLQRLQSFFADFQYDAQTTPESHFRNVLYILCKLMGLQVDAEYQTSDGRIDLLLRTEKYVFVIECKIDSTAKIALQQIKDKEYALPWTLDNREKILIGINFSTTTRRPDDWIIERGDGSIIEGGQKKWSEKGGQKKVVRNRGKNTAVIFGLIKANPSITRDQLSAEVHIAPSAVQKHIEKLKQGYIVRADGDRGGYWVILKEWEA